MWNYSRLMKLVLSEKYIEFIPESLQECEKLEELNLRKNKIKEIPKWITNMNHLKRLDLTGNPIKNRKVPDYILID